MIASFKPKILIDIGSSTVKVYKLNFQGSVQLLETNSFQFKQDFDPSQGLAQENRKKLLDYIVAIKRKYPGCIYKTYATALFRKMSAEAGKKMIDEFYSKTGIFFNIISHEMESFYLQRGVLSKFPSNEVTLLINIGGGSTELAVVKNHKLLGEYNINIGAGVVMSKFPKLNDIYSGYPLEVVVNDVKQMLPDIKSKIKLAFYTGGELTYMLRSDYKLVSNDLFDDAHHPYKIQLADFGGKNEKIFSEIRLKELESYMPEDPKWMHGARGCSAIAQAICEKYNIDTIVPSNINTMDGVCEQEFKMVTLSGSFRKHLDYILGVKSFLEKQGTTIISPRFSVPKNPREEFVVFDGEEGMAPLDLERYHLDCIAKSDALIVCDPDGYVGASALIEIGAASNLGKRIIFTEKPQEFMLNTLPAEVGL
jgi:hypothetical protein